MDWTTLYAENYENPAPVSEVRKQFQVDKAMKEHEEAGSHGDPALIREWEEKLADLEDKRTANQEHFESGQYPLLKDVGSEALSAKATRPSGAGPDDRCI